MKFENIIIKIEPDSIAEELGIVPGDVLLDINGKKVKDIFDYRYLIQEEYLELTIRSENEEWVAEVEKDFDEDLGIVFESGLMDDAKSCKNKCIFCFIDQLPKGMRESLYFKDDDSRLSFLQGNYVTLTNMSKQDIEHIIFYHLSPINISVHTTDLALRKEMLKNPKADQVLVIMEELAKNKISMNLQVVLCRGINDKEHLDKTIGDCAKFFPYAKSMSVVPLGITKYRDKLHPMTPFDKESSKEVLEQIIGWQKRLKEEVGTAFVFAADEFYLKANYPLPQAKAYEDFSQYENGVGMLSLLKEEFYQALEENRSLSVPWETREISIATGVAAAGLLGELAKALEKAFSGLTISVYAIVNEFFGEEITVSGLLTGQDILKQLEGKALGERLFLPDNLLRKDTTVLLDDMTIADLETGLGVPIGIVENQGHRLFCNLLDLEDEK